MMKKIITTATLLLATFSALAQTNIQEMYDFKREHFTTTLEMFKADKWGSTFFFTDIYHPSSLDMPTGYYTEISRSLNFWKHTPLSPLSLHIEWNGGQMANNAWLLGIEYLIHSSDFRNTFTFELMYKTISHTQQDIPLQFTFVWGMQQLFGIEGLSFSGFLDIWGENHQWNNTDTEETPTKWVLLTEPQLWYNIGKHIGCPNLNIGGEIEMAYNFAGAWQYKKGFSVAPCLGLKWNF